MFNEAFFRQIKQIVDDVMRGSSEVWVERKKSFNPATNTLSDQSPSGGATPAAVGSVRKQLIDGKSIRLTDIGLIIPASGLSFEIQEGDKIHLGATSAAEPVAMVVAVFPIQSPTVKIGYEIVARI